MPLDWDVEADVVVVGFGAAGACAALEAASAGASVLVLDAHLGGQPFVLIGFESKPLTRHGGSPVGGPAPGPAGNPLAMHLAFFTALRSKIGAKTWSN